MEILVHQNSEATANREKVQDPTRKKKRRVERRKSSTDRRSLTNDGIVVNLSTSSNDERSRFDRRQRFVPPHISRESQQRPSSVFVDIIA